MRQQEHLHTTPFERRKKTTDQVVDEKEERKCSDKVVTERVQTAISP